MNGLTVPSQPTLQIPRAIVDDLVAQLRRLAATLEGIVLPTANPGPSADPEDDDDDGLDLTAAEWQGHALARRASSASCSCKEDCP